ncbi:MAG: hypothetical protein ACJARX_000412 [Psychroserpens sp.]|jgi:hypothetical protein|uniref:hypothetical protein n=1 Tax=Psychroserpens sp. TaxID=2020870 RepID=UPI0039E64A75
MKYFKILVILFSSVLFFYGCNDKSKTPKEEAVKQVVVPNAPVLPKTSNPNIPAVEPAQNANGVWHYTCRLGCAGGAGAAINCETCGTALAHNSTYHGAANATSSSAPFATPPPAPPKEPAQNAAGVWHYTCANGCLGGSGAAGTCSTCNSALSHNQAYH